MSHLAELTAGSVADANARKAKRPKAAVEKAALKQKPALDALELLQPAEQIKIIAEVKRASPSRGHLSEIPDPAQLAVTYQTGGASAISVLTEERKFKGSLADLEAVRSAVTIPVLRKDFVATEYQVFEARAAGADLVLLIVAALDQKKLASLHELVRELGMTALVETHSAEEIDRALDVGAGLIGVNARDLTTLELDKELFGRVADRIPSGVVRVAESAVLKRKDVARYRDAGADVVLVGEALVTDGDPIRTLEKFLSV
ncbi:indole-3-glycerol phosphate synthase TrpC [Gryllotalpicola protaetiae]|uniref:Indole-3-glycerol phosphate synthase n=1 Tax=Gryllotalpicola protaetiae TaxID=2419771 RepID=A0A387BM67_9MICO|nr:indole-3-glycerol phosphate synthase TrpC [Gryllotalpicola protaetiae]AYG04913.1 indole-3-glycerol phosphate synthase TrpC [Gryllotalpicola protaetiae]